MRRLLITGGCGFIGSSLALNFKEKYESVKVSVLDNLRRRGSELNINIIKKAGVEFIHGDIRNIDDLREVGDFDCLIECSAEPSVLTGYGGTPRYALDTNLSGTVNCLETARERGADFIFLSTSRVYPYELLSGLSIVERQTRFELDRTQTVPGASDSGISEEFPMTGPRSLYGATKLASEFLITEYESMYGMRAVVNRCGLVAGPGQFGKVDQGVVALWLARHYWRQELEYIGFNGSGKQVRDILHVRDLFDLIDIEVVEIEKYKGNTYNVGGGKENSLSLLEMTQVCEQLTGNRLKIGRQSIERPADLPVYISDISKVSRETGWRPRSAPESVFGEVHEWVRVNEQGLLEVLR